MDERPDTYRLQESLPVYDLGDRGELYTQRKSILVIEDEEDLNLALTCRLREAGFHVLSSFDARSGLEKTGFHKPDLVLLDIALPGMDGFGFLHEFMDVERLARVPVIVMTGKYDDETREEAERLGVRRVLEKPVSHREVVELCAEILGHDLDQRYSA